MGRKTFESIGKVLPYRQTVIISNQGPELVNRIVKECKVPKNTPTPLVINSYDVQRSLGGLAENLDLHKIYICGGASIYDLMSPFVENWIVTRYNVNVEADGVKKKLLPKNFDPDKLIRVSLPFLNRDWLPMDHGVFQNIQYVVRTYRTGYIPENYDPDTGERKI